MMASASSADLRCCTSKSGGTYSASITGVIGSTLTSRTEPPDVRAIVDRGLDGGLGQIGIGEVDRNQDLLVHDSAPLFRCEGGDHGTFSRARSCR